MDGDDLVTVADELETSEVEGPRASELPDHVGEKPEADALEQARPVDKVGVRVVPPARDEVPEADWLEQSIVEPIDEDELR